MNFREILFFLGLLFGLFGVINAQNPFDVAAKRPVQSTPVLDTSKPIKNQNLDTLSEVVQFDSKGSVKSQEEFTNSPLFDRLDSSAKDSNVIELQQNENADNVDSDTIVEYLEKNKDHLKPSQKSELIIPEPVKKFQKNIESTGSRIKVKYLSFGYVILVLGLMAFLFNYDRPLINKIFEAAINGNMSKILYREDFIRIKWLFHVHYLVFFLNAGFIVYQALTFFSGFEKVWYLPLSIGIVVLMYLLKHAVVFTLTVLSKDLFDIKFYAYQIEHINIVLGMILVPFVLILAVTSGYVFEYTLYASITLMLIIYFYRQIRAFLFSVNLFATHTFHFFIYLCALELLPVALLTKFVIGLTI